MKKNYIVSGSLRFQRNYVICVYVCVCVYVYVVYEDTNLYNDMGMTGITMGR